MNASAELLDTNVLVYAFSTDPRSIEAERLMASRCAVALQGINEFSNVARRKLVMSWTEVAEAVSTVRALCSRVLPLDIDTHTDALVVAERDGLSFYDALMVSAALRANCTVLWSEDMQHDRLIDGRLRILNPFRRTD